MKLLPRNCLLQDNVFLNKINSRGLFTLLAFLSLINLKAQIANYVNNGGFEEHINTTSYPIPKYWSATDTSKVFGQLLSEILPPYLVPLSSYGYQWPRHGESYLGTLLYCSTCPYNKRGYPRNRLKQTLQQGSTYCVSIYVNLTNQSTHGIDAIGCYFSDSSIDTIKLCNVPITFLTPQIQNPLNNIITDTLSWIQIKGQFVANGSEKYLMIGNFKSDAITNKVLVNPANLPGNAANYLLDDVSCIPIDLPAYAGHDTTCIPGTSVYLGRQRDVEIDESCMWYKLPVTITPTTPAIDTAAGIWVSPTQTSTYVVKQQLWCSGVKYDTVVVYKDGVGLEKLQIADYRLQIWPNPVDEILTIETQRHGDSEAQGGLRARITNSLGQVIKDEELVPLAIGKNQKAQIQTADLPNGVYLLTLKDSRSETLSKRFVINR